jgi:hypothetical protein
MPMSTGSSFSNSRLSVIERRDSSRIAFDCPVRWSTSGRENLGWARNVSESGAAFTTALPQSPLPGDKIHLVLDLDPLCAWTVDNKAEVIRCEPVNDQLCHVAVRLSPMPIN